MDKSLSAKTTLEIAFGALLLAWIIVLVPSPIHDWFTSTDIGGVPLDVIALAMSIMFTPPFILTTILRKYDVDYEDENQTPPANIAAHHPM